MPSRLTGSLPAQGETPAVDPTALVRSLAQEFDRETAGYVVRRSETAQQATAGVLSTTSAEVEDQVLNDYEIVEVRVVSEQSDGKREDAATIASDTIRRNEEERRRGPFHWAFLSKYVNEYRYAVVPCTQCRPGQVSVAFQSDRQDEVHASGVFVLDSQAKRVVSLGQSPYVQNQSDLDQSTQAIAFGQTGGLWVPLRATIDFKAHYGVLRGGGSATFVYSNYRRVPTIDAARDLLGNAVGVSARRRTAASLRGGDR